MDKNKKLFISVVIPTCNRPNTLMKCIESIISNNYQNCEIIVVDQSDNSETYVQLKKKFYADEIIKYLHSDIKCSSDSRNKGWQKASGAIVAFTDDDAYVVDGWLDAYSVAFSDENPRIGMVGGRVEPVYQIPRPSWLPHEKDYLLPSFDAGTEMKEFPPESLPISVNFALRRTVLEATGGFDTRLGLKKAAKNPYIGGEDSFLAKKIKDSGYFILYQPSAIVYHPVTAARLTRKFFIKRNFREGITAIALENAKNRCNKDELSSHMKWHINRFLHYGRLLMRDFIIKKRPEACMLQVAEMAYSAGAVHHAYYLMKNL
jgi:glycosyltransferase involved in cell wall biosynthesis